MKYFAVPIFVLWPSGETLSKQHFEQPITTSLLIDTDNKYSEKCHHVKIKVLNPTAASLSSAVVGKRR